VQLNLSFVVVAYVKVLLVANLTYVESVSVIFTPANMMPSFISAVKVFSMVAEVEGYLVEVIPTLISNE
jgi:hypothetical protein